MIVNRDAKKSDKIVVRRHLTTVLPADAARGINGPRICNPTK